MKKNLGITDRIIRFTMVDLLLGLSISGLEIPLIYTNAAFIFSLCLVLTIITGYSVIYHFLGISTREKQIAK